MAIVSAPALSLRASGNLGAICYTRWRGLLIAKSAWSGTYTPTPTQLESEARMTTVSKAWGQVLTHEQREAWNEAAVEQTWKDRLAGDYVPLGYQYFYKLNLNRAFMGYGILEWPPVRIPKPLAESIDVEWKDDIKKVWMKLILTTPGGWTGRVQYFKAGPFKSPGRGAREGEWRYLGWKSAGSRLYDADVEEFMWHWYYGRWFADVGVVGNRFSKQVYAGV